VQTCSTIQNRTYCCTSTLVWLQKLFKQNSFNNTCVKNSKALNMPKHYIIHTLLILFLSNFNQNQNCLTIFFLVKFPNIKFQWNLFSNSGVKYEQTDGHSTFLHALQWYGYYWKQWNPTTMETDTLTYSCN